MSPATCKLADNHRALIERSAISTDVAARRGYFTATTGAQLGRLGFETYQRIPPALVLPSWGVTGSIVNYQARPDRPRIDRERGREIRYETVSGSHIRLDVPPGCRDRLGRPIAPLWVTEGIRKGDSLASRGLCAVALLGVNCWDCREDWERIALDGRHVYVVYDNDVMRKRGVHGALQRLAKFLAGKGATVHPVYLPEDVGKIGVDDYLAAGHSTEDLYALAEDELRPPPPEPKPEREPAWNTGVLLHYIEVLLTRFVRLPSEHARTALALYVMHTHAFAAAAATPYLYIKSPQKRAGKTRLLEVLTELCHRPVRASSVTEAAIFQSIEAWRPTLLVDEVDAIFYGRSERAEALRLVLDAGNRPGNPVIRGTQEGKPKLFETFSPKVLAGIDRGLPDTIRDRAIVIAMERKARSEPVERMRARELAEPLKSLRGRLSDWAAEHQETLGKYRLEEPLSEISDRLEEAWEPLLAIADLAGDAWPQRARTAAIKLAEADTGNETLDDGEALLRALETVFTNLEELHSKAICEELNKDDELPFHNYRKGAGIDGNGLGRLLKPYGVRSQKFAAEGKQARGYRRDQFEEAWNRYTRDGTPAVEPSSPSTRPPEPENHGAEPQTGWTGGGTAPVHDPSTPAPPVDGTDGWTAKRTAPVHDPSTPQTAVSSQNGHRADGWTGWTPEVQAPLRTPHNGNGHATLGESTLADLPDVELLAAVPGATIEHDPHGRAPCSYERHRAIDWRLHPRGGPAPPWVCGVCHPPPFGLDIEHRTQPVQDGTS